MNQETELYRLQKGGRSAACFHRRSPEGLADMVELLAENGCSHVCPDPVPSARGRIGKANVTASLRKNRFGVVASGMGRPWYGSCSTRIAPSPTPRPTEVPLLSSGRPAGADATRKQRRYDGGR